MINNKNSIQFPQERRFMLTLCPNIITTRFLLFITIAKSFKCLQSVRSVHEGRRNIFEHFRQRSLREIVGNLRKWLLRCVFGNPGHDETKISRI